MDKIKSIVAFRMSESRRKLVGLILRSVNLRVKRKISQKNFWKLTVMENLRFLRKTLALVSIS